MGKRGGGGGGVAFALSQFRGLDYLGTWNSRYSESVFLSEEVKKKWRQVF